MSTSPKIVTIAAIVVVVVVVVGYIRVARVGAGCRQLADLSLFGLRRDKTLGLRTSAQAHSCKIDTNGEDQREEEGDCSHQFEARIPDDGDGDRRCGARHDEHE